MPLPRVYTVTLRSDQGRVRIQTTASSPAWAATIVCACEGAPRTAVLSVVPA